MNARQLTITLLAFAAALGPISATSAQEWDRSYTAAGVAYLSGGIGSMSRDQLATREKEFNLKLVSTIAGTGNYVSDVALTIADNTGNTVIAHTSQGPVFMAKLPESAYIVTATFRGQTQTRKFHVSASRLHTEYLRWQARTDEDWTLPWDSP